MFDLTKNPFSILRVSPRASSDDLSNAKADRMFDHAFPESVLEGAYAELLVERKRLIHELSWLSDIAPNRARKIIDILPNIKIEDAIELLDECGALSALNLAAHLAGYFPEKRTFALNLISHYEVFDWAQVRHAIDEARTLSGAKKTTDDGWRKAKAALVNIHASALLPSITKFDDGPEWLASILSEGEHTVSNELLERIIGQYDQWSIPQLTALSEKIDESLIKLKVAEVPDAEVEVLEDLLVDWDRISQPVQLRDQAKGLDEKRSLELFYKVRDVAIWFANDRDEPEIAERITKAFATAFVELPTVRAKTAADLITLSENIEFAAESSLLSQLKAAMANGDLKEAKNLVAQFIEAHPSSYDKLSTIQDNIDSQLRKRVLKRVGWGVAAGLVGLYVINEDNSNSYAGESVTDYTYEMPTDYGDEISEDPTVDDTDELALYEDESEDPPNPYASGPLTLAQLRYCRFENARLERLKGRIGNRFTAQFNTKIDDYNSRCGAFEYRMNDLAQIDAEVAANSDRIRQEASSQMEQWTESRLGSNNGMDWSNVDPPSDDIPVVKPKSAVEEFRAERKREIDKIIKGIDSNSNGTSGAPNLGPRKTDDASIFSPEPELDRDE